MSGRVIRFVYANPPGFSGQRNAARLVWTGLGDRGWDCRLFALPTLDRTADSSRGCIPRIVLLVRVVQTWLVALRLRSREPAAYTFLACSQTVTGLVRDGITFLILTAGRRGSVAVIALNGNAFSSWSFRDPRARVFRFLARNATCVTVVGDGQRDRLAALGVPPERIRVVSNTADAPLLAAAQVESKQRESHGPVRLLYLSSLITSKGYPTYLEALNLLAHRDGPPLEAILCGAIVASPHDEFGSESAARVWIQEALAEIGQTRRIRVRWIPGAAGDEKYDLLSRCHVFVLPTLYPVEAQPLALLEAMASGCAIVTTGIAEIPVLLPRDANVAVIIDDPTPSTVADAVERLVREPEARMSLAMAARGRYADCFAGGQHIDAWERLFADIGRGS